MKGVVICSATLEKKALINGQQKKGALHIYYIQIKVFLINSTDIKKN